MSNSDPEIVDFENLDDFVDEIISSVLDSSGEFYSVDVVASGGLAESLLHTLIGLKADNGEFLFDFGDLTYDFEYGKEYYISIDDDMRLFCEPAWRDNEYGVGYIMSDCSKAFVQGSTNSRLLSQIHADDDIVIFDIGEEDSFVD